MIYPLKMVIFNSDLNFPEGIRGVSSPSISRFWMTLVQYQPLEDSLSIKFNMQLPGHGSADTVTRDLNSITFQEWMSWMGWLSLIVDSRLIFKDAEGIPEVHVKLGLV